MCSPFQSKIGILLPNNQRQHRTLHIQEDVRPYALCWLLCPVSVAVARIHQKDLISTSYPRMLAVLAFVAGIPPAM